MRGTHCAVSGSNYSSARVDFSPLLRCTFSPHFCFRALASLVLRRRVPLFLALAPSARSPDLAFCALLAGMGDAPPGLRRRAVPRAPHASE